jgi:hypothetical protein
MTSHGPAERRRADPSLGQWPEPARDEEFRRALLRGAGLLLGTLVLATAFIAAYAGALHKPHPRNVPVGVVRGDQPAQQLLAAVRAQTDQLKPIEYADRAAADDALTGRVVYAVLASGQPGGGGPGPSGGPGPTPSGGSKPGSTPAPSDDGPGLALTTASAAAPAADDLITRLLGAAAQRARVPLAVTDRVPVSPEDPRGLVPFYLAIGLVLGGYLGSAVLGISVGTTPANLRRAALRTGAFAVYSVLLGLAGALVTGPGLGVWHTRFASIAAADVLIVFTAAMVAAAMQGWLGLLGTGLVILLLVVIGNPGSGGIYPPEFLPGLFAGMHRWNVPGLATDLVKSVVYFQPRAVGWPVTWLSVWVLAGLVALLTATVVRNRRVAAGGPGSGGRGPGSAVSDAP